MACANLRQTVGAKIADRHDSGVRAGHEVADKVGTPVAGPDDGNRLLQKTVTFPGLPAQSLAYGYYPDGSRQSLTTPAGTIPSFTAANLTNGIIGGWAIVVNGTASAEFAISRPGIRTQRC